MIRDLRATHFLIAGRILILDLQILAHVSIRITVTLYPLEDDEDIDVLCIPIIFERSRLCSSIFRTTTVVCLLCIERIYWMLIMISLYFVVFEISSLHWYILFNLKVEWKSSCLVIKISNENGSVYWFFWCSQNCFSNRHDWWNDS